MGILVLLKTVQARKSNANKGWSVFVTRKRKSDEQAFAEGHNSAQP